MLGLGRELGAALELMIAGVLSEEASAVVWVVLAHREEVGRVREDDAKMVHTEEGVDAVMLAEGDKEVVDWVKVDELVRAGSIVLIADGDMDVGSNAMAVVLDESVRVVVRAEGELDNRTADTWVPEEAGTAVVTVPVTVVAVVWAAAPPATVAPLALLTAESSTPPELCSTQLFRQAS